jgi:hypothetical protein
MPQKVTYLPLSMQRIKSKFSPTKMKKSFKKSTSGLVIKFGTVCLIMIFGCYTPSAELSKYEDADILAKKIFGNGYEIDNNKSGTLILCYKVDKKKSQPHTSVEYFVYNMNTKEIIFEEKLYDTDIKWLDDNNIEIRTTPEVISGDDDITVYILNVLTKEKQKTNLIN